MSNDNPEVNVIKAAVFMVVMGAMFGSLAYQLSQFNTLVAKEFIQSVQR